MDLDNKNQPAIGAVTTPLGQTILLPSHEVAAYEALVAEIQRRFQPETYLQKSVAQSIVDTEWRLRRIARLEEALYTLGRNELANVPDPDLLNSKIRDTYRKQFKHLTQQERYLRKRLKTDTAELNQMLKDNPKHRRGLFLVPKRTQK